MKYPESAIRLRDLRERANLTQKKVAEELNVGQGAVSHWESGDTQPARKYHCLLAQLYNVPTNELLQHPQDR